MVTIPSTRPGCMAAARKTRQEPLHIPTQTAWSIPSASMTAMVSATYSVSA